MSLFTTATASNRVVTKGLTTTLTRELITGGKWLNDANPPTLVSVPDYWLYTRTRSKSYAYIGMTKAAAISTAQTLQEYYRRRQNPQVYKTNAASGNAFVPRYGSGDESIPAKASGGVYYLLDEVQAANVVASQDGNGSAWRVDIEVNEVVEYRFRDAGSSVNQPDEVIEDDYDYDPITAANNTTKFKRWHFNGEQTAQDFTYEE